MDAICSNPIIWHDKVLTPEEQQRLRDTVISALSQLTPEALNENMNQLTPAALNEIAKLFTIGLFDNGNFIFNKSADGKDYTLEYIYENNSYTVNIHYEGENNNSLSIDKTPLKSIEYFLSRQTSNTNGNIFIEPEYYEFETDKFLSPDTIKDISQGKATEENISMLKKVILRHGSATDSEKHINLCLPDIGHTQIFASLSSDGNLMIVYGTENAIEKEEHACLYLSSGDIKQKSTRWDLREWDEIEYPQEES